MLQSPDGRDKEGMGDNTFVKVGFGFVDYSDSRREFIEEILRKRANFLGARLLDVRRRRGKKKC